MVIVSLLFLVFISINIISNSVKSNNINKYINEMERELSTEVENTRIKDNKIS